MQELNKSFKGNGNEVKDAYLSNVTTKEKVKVAVKWKAVSNVSG